MIEASVRQQLDGELGWRRLEDSLRPFIARRIQSEAAVDDVLQDVFLRMQRGLGSLRDEHRFGAWVYKLTRNTIADHMRSAARHPLASDEPTEQPDTTVVEATDDGDARELAGSCAVVFVAMLPSPYREALTLTELEGLTQKAAADMLGISLPAMKSRVQRGRQKLRTALEGCCQFALDARKRVMDFTPRDGKAPSGCCS